MVRAPGRALQLEHAMCTGRGGSTTTPNTPTATTSRTATTATAATTPTPTPTAATAATPIHSKQQTPI
eukprot:3708852-Pyramimonas_sp.AAC.1